MAVSRVRVGCTGWGYDDWRGGFYPPGCDAGEYLERYARVFGLTEVDSTYYRTPSRLQVARWARVTPDGFTFSVKLPGTITHEAGLRNCGEALDGFLHALEPLRVTGRLGPLVVQLPASFRRERDADALEAFLDRIPTGHRVAVELRHRSWWKPETYRALEARNAALVWSVNQYAQTPPVRTADFVYARFIGDRKLTRFHEVQRDDTATLRAWAERLRDEGRHAVEIYALANNHFMGHAPATALRLQEILDLPRADLAAAKRTEGQRSLTDF